MCSPIMYPCFLILYLPLRLGRYNIRHGGTGTWLKRLTHFQVIFLKIGEDFKSYGVTFCYIPYYVNDENYYVHRI